MTDNNNDDRHGGIEDSIHAGPPTSENNASRKRGREEERSSQPTKRSRTKGPNDQSNAAIMQALTVPKPTSMTTMRQVNQADGALVLLPPNSLYVQEHQGMNRAQMTVRPKEAPAALNWGAREPGGQAMLIKTGTSENEARNATNFVYNQIVNTSTPYYLTFWPEDPLMAAKDMQTWGKKYHRADRSRSRSTAPGRRGIAPRHRGNEVVCANCEDRGHELGKCSVPSSSQHGDIFGCPMCNKRHAMETCPKFAALSKEDLFRILILDRGGMCRIRISVSWIVFLQQCEEFWPRVTKLPLSKAYVSSLAKSSKATTDGFWDSVKNTIDPATKDVQTAIEGLKNGSLAAEAAPRLPDGAPTSTNGAAVPTNTNQPDDSAMVIDDDHRVTEVTDTNSVVPDPPAQQSGQQTVQTTPAVPQPAEQPVVQPNNVDPASVPLPKSSRRKSKKHRRDGLFSPIHYDTSEDEAQVGSEWESDSESDVEPNAEQNEAYAVEATMVEDAIWDDEE